MRGPIPNSYRLRDGQLIAGEYPGDRDETSARDKLEALLDAGVTTFIDLTESHELAPYDALASDMARARGREVTYHRLSIRDISVPESPAVMNAILDQIDQAIDAGGVVYVHCWGGVGRTGTVVGCHLVRCGMTGDEALAKVAELFKHMEKYPRRRHSPETEEQAAYVRSWSEAAPNVDAKASK
jgi:protein-tyrosine phosphatase